MGVLQEGGLNAYVEVFPPDNLPCRMWILLAPVTDGYLRAWLLVLLLVWALPRPGAAQTSSIELELERKALPEALETLRAEAGVDIVYAQRLAEPYRVTCSYQGESVQAALDCVLSETGLRVEAVRGGQYVLMAEGGAEAAQASRGVLSGFVMDGETGEVLPGAHVYLADLRQGTVTNAAGYFALPGLPRGPYEARISHLGYEAADTVITAGAPEATLFLEPSTIAADGIVVEGEAERHDERSTVPGLVSISSRSLERLPSFTGEADLLQALAWMPGIHRAGEVNGGLLVRGGEADQNLYLIDGAPVYHPWHAFSLISTFQTETFKNVNLYRSALPAEHGGRLSSVLDAEMRDGSRESGRMVAALSLLSGRLVVEDSIGDDVSFMLAGRRSYIDKLAGSRHPVEEAGRRDTLRTGYYFYDMSAKVTYRPGTRHRLSASYYGGGDDLDLRLPFDLSLDFSSWLRPADLFFEVDHNWGNQLLSGRYQYLHADRLYVTTTAYWSGYQAQEQTLIRPSDVATITSDYGVRLRDVGLKLDVDYYHSLTHQLRAGVHLARKRFHSALDAHVERSAGAIDVLDQQSETGALELAGYVQDTWRPGSRWQLQPGLRASYFSRGRYAHLQPRFNARFVVSPRWLTLRGGASLQVQYLHQLRDRHSFLYDLVSNRWIASDSTVRPAISRQVSLGLEGTPASWLELTADAYVQGAGHLLLPEDNTQSKDGLEGPGIEVGTLLGQYTPGEGHAYGVELGMHVEEGPWTGRVGFTQGRSLSRAPALDEEHFRPRRFDTPQVVEGMVQRRSEHWTLGLSLYWRDGYPETVPVARYALGDPLDEEPAPYLYRPEINNGRLPSYARLDAMAGYRWEMGSTQARLQLTLYNVTNRRNVVARHYDPASEGSVEATNRRGLPILPLLKLHVAR